jgi:HNH endonuclease
MTSYIPDAVRHRVIEAFGNRCSYCLAAQRYVLSKLEIEHIIPVTLGGSNDEVNLCTGLTPVGRATVEALRINNEIAVEVRRNWVLAGWHPPSDAR